MCYRVAKICLDIALLRDPFQTSIQSSALMLDSKVRQVLARLLQDKALFAAWRFARILSTHWRARQQKGLPSIALGQKETEEDQGTEIHLIKTADLFSKTGPYSAPYCVTLDA